jgi:hypothetical protein
MASHEETLTDVLARQHEAKHALAKLIAEGPQHDDDERTVMQLTPDEVKLIQAVRAVAAEQR